MPALIPVQRFDRNGRLVTRWVKSNSDTRKTVLPIPPSVIASSPRASDATKRDLEDYFENFAVTERYPYRDSLRRNVALMSEDNASELVHGLWEGYSAFADPETVAGTLERIYGESSPISEAHRDTVFQNLIEIVPDYAMNWDSDNDGILKYTWVIFDAVGGEQTTRLFNDEDKIVYQSAACITNHIFKELEGSSDELKLMGFDRPDGSIDEGQDSLVLDGTAALEALRENIDYIATLRDALRHRNSLHVDVIKEIVGAGVLGEGVL